MKCHKCHKHPFLSIYVPLSFHLRSTPKRMKQYESPFPRPPVLPRPLSRGSRALPAPDDCGLPPVSGSPQRPGHRLQEKEESHRPASPSHHGISRRPVIVPTDCPIQLPTDCPIQFITDCPFQFSTEYPVQFSTEYPVQFTTDCPIQLPTGCCLQSCAILRHRP